jgi:hypothetical protein
MKRKGYLPKAQIKGSFNPALWKGPSTFADKQSVVSKSSLPVAGVYTKRDKKDDTKKTNLIKITHNIKIKYKKSN